jgi:hypothetical protein
LTNHAAETRPAYQGLGPSREAFGGILDRRERWALSLRGKLLALGMMLGAVVALMLGLYPWLAITSRTRGNVAVVEGWAHTDPKSIAQAADACRKGDYRCIVVVRDVYAGRDRWDSAGYIAREFACLGIDRDRVFVVACDVFNKDRTYHAALAVRRWLHQQGVSAKAMDVVTIGTHARRSRLLFQKAFGREVDVGVIALAEEGYDAQHWWRTSEGVREVLFEGVAYLYARLLFHPLA